MASWLALDWDQDQFHLLSVQTSRRGVQVTRALTWAHPEPFTPSTADRVGKALREFLKTEKFANASVIVGIGRDRLHLRELKVPPIAAHEEAALVRFQTAKEMTEPIDNYVIDYAYLNPGKRDGERQIMTVAARREMAQMIQTLCVSAGLKLHAVTPRLFGIPAALARAVQPDPSPLAPDKRNVILTLGQRWAELTFYRGEQLVQAQSISKGPLLASEVKRSLAVFQAQHAVEMDVTGPECLYVFGDDAAAIQALQAGVHLPIVSLDPLDQEDDNVLDTKNPGAFAGAVGLTLLWSQTKNRPVNLVSPRKQQAPASANRKRGLVYGIVGVLVLLAGIGGMYYVIATKKAKLKELTELNAANEEFVRTIAQERADIEAFKEWEQTTIPWLDEIYDLTARFPDDIGFRVNQLSATTAAKKGKDGFVGRISLSGFTPAGNPGNVDKLHRSMERDAHLRASFDRLKGTSPLEFQMKIDVAKQPYEKYDSRLIFTRPRQIEMAAPNPGPVMKDEDPEDED